MNYIGDFPEDFTTVTIFFTTHDPQGAPVAPLTAFETADFKIYKDGSATEKTSTNGLTIASPFDSIVGLHCLVIDTSNDTGDASWWLPGHTFSVLLNPDTETVNGQVPLKIIGTFTLAMNLRSTTAGRTLDVTATGAAGIDWGNLENATTSNVLSSTTVGTATAVTTVNGLAANAISAAAIATGAIDADAIATDGAQEIADALLDRSAGVETGLTPRQAMRLFAAALLGKASGLATTTAVFRDTGDSKDRITATVDANGNRTAVTLDAT